MQVETNAKILINKLNIKLYQIDYKTQETPIKSMEMWLSWKLLTSFTIQHTLGFASK